jgi:hypothetical protein
VADFFYLFLNLYLFISFFFFFFFEEVLPNLKKRDKEEHGHEGSERPKQRAWQLSRELFEQMKQMRGKYKTKGQNTKTKFQQCVPGCGIVGIGAIGGSRAGGILVHHQGLFLNGLVPMDDGGVEGKGRGEVEGESGVRVQGKSGDKVKVGGGGGIKPKAEVGSEAKAVAESEAKAEMKSKMERN